MIFDYMAKTHALCDEMFTKAENLAGEGKWAEADNSFKAFVSETEKHFGKEENILFPRVEEVMGSGGGPTQVMRMEHEQMRELIASLSDVVEQQDQGEFLGEAETLLVLMQQHNMKEEQILYPMIDRVAGENATSLIGEMEQV